MNRLTYKEYLSIALILSIVGAISLFMNKPWQSFGSVVVGNEYSATSTGVQTSFPNYRNAMRSNFVPGYATVTPGVLGSVVITTPGASRFCLYDATSTATNADASYGPVGTTTIACFGASAPAGTYTFDAAVRKGVLVEYLSADTVGWASSTITWR